MGFDCLTKEEMEEAEKYYYEQWEKEWAERKMKEAYEEGENDENA